MKFVFKNHLEENIVNLMRKAGYYFLLQEESDISFIRPLERSGYPRFHIHVEARKEADEILFKLHLDQKRAIYKGAPAHAGEYEGEVIEREAERIKQILGQ